jgi:hypothetical protein
VTFLWQSQTDRSLAALIAFLRPWLLRVWSALALAGYLRQRHRRRLQQGLDDGFKFVFWDFKGFGHGTIVRSVARIGGMIFDGGRGDRTPMPVKTFAVYKTAPSAS